MTDGGGELDAGGGGGGGERDERDRDGAGHECPECGRSFSTAMGLGLHRSREHGVKGINRRRKESGGRDRAPRRTRETHSRSDRSRLVSESITELVDLFQRRGDNVAAMSVADVLRRDADKIGDALASLAERQLFSALGPVIDTLFGAGGPLSFITALGPTFRKLLAGRPPRRHVDDELAQLQAEYERIYTHEGPERALTWAALNGLEVT